ncbi:hypothetical protein EV193_101215 [Herbihabitans rhizosphaerae]|uniref:Uncharacterized protein n=1 Tax=Herbihabitans rhizosphaerae TaxID=1872711 RepID=A0A4Q7L665_9PSEU|nr:hypothetical protein [Herbihabitans rhizosphaerae]RZS44340.1 hypothetical protein EV193_101215 [Herbihabitans rhizosphaerae]
MAEAITDKNVVAALRPFVRATTPMLDALRESDPLGIVRRSRQPGDADLDGVDKSLKDKVLDGLESVKVPGTEAWSEMDIEARTDWWVNRVGRFTTLVAAIPGIGGALADRLPIQDALGAASQGLLLCAIAAERGMTEQADRVRLLAAVLFDRDVDRALAAGEGDGLTDAEEDKATAELTEELDESTKKHGKITLKAAARTLWRFGRALLALSDELEKRPRGRFYHRALGMLPVVGMAGDYFGERSALKRAAKKAVQWMESQPA